MNEKGYGSREACEKLVELGIVLETEAYWYWDQSGEWKLVRIDSKIMQAVVEAKEAIPALSMAEAWRELPDIFNGAYIEIWKVANYTYCSYCDCDGNLQLTEHSISNTNPADALIYLRIWLEERKEESHEPTPQSDQERTEFICSGNDNRNRRSIGKHHRGRR